MRKIITLAAMTAASVALAPLALRAADPTTQSPSSMSAGQQASAAPSQAAQVLAKIHDANKAEIDMGKMAKDKAQSQAVKDYGDQLVQDHKQAEDRLDAVAKAQNIDYKADKTTEKADKQQAKANTDMLKAKKGTAFDRAFLQHMADDHQKVISMLQSSKDQLTDSPEVQAFITDILPTLQEHERKANELLQQIGSTNKS